MGYLAVEHGLTMGVGIVISHNSTVSSLFAVLNFRIASTTTNIEEGFSCVVFETNLIKVVDQVVSLHQSLLVLEELLRNLELLELAN